MMRYLSIDVTSSGEIKLVGDSSEPEMPSQEIEISADQVDTLIEWLRAAKEEALAVRTQTADDD